MVNNSSSYFILSDDYYLCQGIKHLHPQLNIQQINFNHSCLDLKHELRSAVIIIDGRILLGGSWKAYEKLLALFPGAIQIWLMPIPVLSYLDNVNFLSGIQMNSCIWQLKNELSISTKKESRAFIQRIRLSPNEERLLPYFVEGISFDVLSGFFACSTKTLHAHRLRIATKLGFRSTLHMTSILKRISPMMFETARK